MSLSGSRRCFECGAIYSPSSLGGTPVRCENDGMPLGLELAGRRWRTEAFLGPRVGGGVFIAYHLITGVRAAVSLIYDAREGEMEERMNREIQAQRLLEPHPNLFKLLELGSERDGTRFYVSELAAEQTLDAAMGEWRRPDDAQALFAQVGAVLRPLLRLLTTAHRIGIAHGELDATQVYVTASDAADAYEARLLAPRLYGLRRLGAGPAFVEAVRADLLGMGHLLHQLLFGGKVTLPVPAVRQTAILHRFGTAAGSFILRALDGATAEGRFNTIEEMTNALVALRREISADGKAQEPAACEGVDPAVERTAPTAAPSRMSPGRRASAGSPSGVSGGATPLPELSLPGAPAVHKSTFSGELRQVSFADLLSLPSSPPLDEVVARGRFQTSLPDRVPPKAVLRPVPEPDEVEIELIADEPTPAGRTDAALLGEPTRDLRTMVRPALYDEPTRAPTPALQAQSGPSGGAGKFKLWGWWRR